MRTLKKTVLLLVSLLLLTGVSTAFAASPVGQWSVVFYLEPGLTTGAVQGICFRSNGTWFSTTFSNWNGDWFQKGDRFRWYGDTGTLGTAEFGQFVNNTQIAGEYAHFRVPGTPPVTSTRGNWRASRTGSICGAPASAEGAAPTSDPAGGD